MPRKKKVKADESVTATGHTPTSLTPAEEASLTSLMQLDDVDKVIRAALPILISRMMDLALGVFVEVSKVNSKTGDVETRVYQVPPDRQALQYLIENVVGKVPQRVELTGKDGGAVEIVPWMPMAAAEEAGLIMDSPSMIELPERVE